MTKNQLISAAADASGLTRSDTARAVNATLAGLKAALRAGERVTISGLGTFDVTSRAARQGRNPQTGAVIEIPEGRAVRFKPSRGFKESL